MKPARIATLALAGLVVGGLIGVAQKTLQQPETSEQIEQGGNLYRAMPDFHFQDLEGNTRHRHEWQGKILVLNFWASWCPPCREETPGFVQLQEEFRDQGVQFVGIAIDDQRPVRDFVDTYGVDYPILLGDMGAIQMAHRLGNRFEALPYTVVAKPGGEILLRHAGELKAEKLRPLLADLSKPAK